MKVYKLEISFISVLDGFISVNTDQFMLVSLFAPANAGKNKQKVLTIVTSYSKYTRALTCENFCPNSGDSRAVLRCAPPSRHRPPFFCPALVALTHCYSAPMGFVCACCHVHVRYHSLNPQP